MSLMINCLRMLDSEEDLAREGSRSSDLKKKPNFKISVLRRMQERSWSGELGPKPNFRKMRSRSSLGIAGGKMSKKAPPPLHRIRHNAPAAAFDSAPPTPRLVRSSGMRRDWNFEDLRRALEA